jgi:hypothetical protein
MSMSTTTLDPTRCPLCGQANQCAGQVERSTGVAQPPCWCTTAHFDAALLARVPPEARRLACICPRCVEQSAGNSPARA